MPFPPGYDFTLVIDVPEDYGPLTDKIYSVADDGLLCSCEGETHVDYTREGESFEAAVKSALQGMQSIGIRVIRIEVDPQVFGFFMDKEHEEK